MIRRMANEVDDPILDNSETIMTPVEPTTTNVPRKRTLGGSLQEP
jgi:hypothetical protein